MRRGLVALCVLVLLVVAAPAGATLRADGFTLHLRSAARGQVCLVLSGPGAEPGSGTECRRPPRSPFRPLFVHPLNGDAPLALAVPLSVARVTAGGRSFDAVRAHGHPLRLVLAPDVEVGAVVRMYDAEGELIGAAQDPFANLGRIDDGNVVFRGAGMTLRMRRGRTLAPTPLDLDRLVPELCVGIGGRDGGSSSCGPDEPAGRHELTASAGCSPARTLLYGIVAPDVRRVRVVLGSGRRMTTRTRPLAAALGPHRLVAATLPRGEAVRVAQGRSAAGRLLWRARIGEPPAQVTCAEVEGSSAQVVAFHVRTDEARAGVVVARGGRQRLLAADGPGSELCTGLAGADGLDCSTPPVDTELTVLERGGRVLHGVLARDVASVELRLRDGRTRRVATTAGRAYHGRYAGHVRFLVAPLPPGAYVRRAIARDARGRSLGRVFIEGSQSTDRVPVVPGLELERTRYTTEGRTTTSVCVLPRSAQSLIGRLGVCGLGFSSATIVGSVTCAPRRTRLFGTLPRGATGVRVGRYTPVVVRLPGIGRVWLITLPARAGVRSLRYLGHLRTNRFGLTPDARHPLRIPPATRQCGYDLRQDVG